MGMLKGRALLDEQRQAIETINEKRIAMKAAEAELAREERKVERLIRKFSRITRLSSPQRAEFYRAEEVRNDAHKKARAARAAWVEAIDRLLAASERSWIENRSPKSRSLCGPAF